MYVVGFPHGTLDPQWGSHAFTLAKKLSTAQDSYKASSEITEHSVFGEKAYKRCVSKSFTPGETLFVCSLC